MRRAFIAVWRTNRADSGVVRGYRVQPVPHASDRTDPDDDVPTPGPMYIVLFKKYCVND